MALSIENLEVDSLLKQIAKLLTKNQLKVCTAESCTGGLLGFIMTSHPGSSAYYNGGFITYTNFLKETLLKVPKEDISIYGAVSETVAISMAKNATLITWSDIGLSLTGIAGPDGGSIQKPVGTIWCGFKLQKECFAQKITLQGNRSKNRYEAALHSLQQLKNYLEKAL